MNNQPLPDPLLELAARADAGQKLGMQALEFLAALAATQGKVLDFSSAASAMLSNFSAEGLDPDVRQIEERSREITAAILRRFVELGQRGAK